MRIVRIALKVLGVAVLAVIVAGLVLYGLASMTPSEYAPPALSRQEQDDAMRTFVNHISDFGEKAGIGKPFDWTITAEQFNAYLASMDVIASLPFEQPVHPTTKMEKAGIAAPAVAMHPGVLTLMARSTRHDKVVSVDLAFAYDSQGKVTTKVQGMRVGVLPVPRSWAEDALKHVQARLSRDLSEAQKQPDASLGPVPFKRFADFLRNLVAMLGGQCVSPEVVWPLGRHRVLIDRVEVADGKLTIHGVPAPH